MLSAEERADMSEEEQIAWVRSHLSTPAEYDYERLQKDLPPPFAGVEFTTHRDGSASVRAVPHRQRVARRLAPICRHRASRTPRRQTHRTRSTRSNSPPSGDSDESSGDPDPEPSGPLPTEVERRRRRRSELLHVWHYLIPVFDQMAGER